jgi:hypothetical protein
MTTNKSKEKILSVDLIFILLGFLIYGFDTGESFVRLPQFDNYWASIGNPEKVQCYNYIDVIQEENKPTLFQSKAISFKDTTIKSFDVFLYKNNYYFHFYYDTKKLNPTSVIFTFPDKSRYKYGLLKNDKYFFVASNKTDDIFLMSLKKYYLSGIYLELDSGKYLKINTNQNNKITIKKIFECLI